MGEKMTLEQVRDYLREDATSPMSERGFSTQELTDMADVIDAHLTQPAQAVDVGALRELNEWLLRQEGMHVNPDHVAEALTRALGNAQAEGWKVMRFTGSAPRPGDRWEVYGPDGSGGVVAMQDVPSHVCGLLDALSPTPPQPEE